MKKYIAYKLARLTYRFNNIPFTNQIRLWQIKIEMNSLGKKTTSINLWWYKPLYKISMFGIEFKITRKISNWFAHRIPADIRFFQLA